MACSLAVAIVRRVYYLDYKKNNMSTDREKGTGNKRWRVVQR
jgi:hypothetical protein